MRKIKGRVEIKHTHQTIAGIEDALAVMTDVIIELEIMQLRAGQNVVIDLEAVQARVGRAVEILKKLREGPYEYDPDSPSGLRIVIKRRD